MDCGNSDDDKVRLFLRYRRQQEKVPSGPEKVLACESVLRMVEFKITDPKACIEDPTVTQKVTSTARILREIDVCTCSVPKHRTIT